MAQTVVLVSGGSRGLGLSLVRGFLEEDRLVATFSRSNSKELDQLSLQYPGSLLWLPGDLTNLDALSEGVARVERDIGPIFALINNAGVAVDGVLATMRPDEIERVIATNLTGTILLTRLVTRRMLTRSEGVIVNISSIIGLRGYAGLAAYAATKGGIDALTRALARELGPRNIRVNSVAPGYLETEMTHGLDDLQRTQIIRRTPMGRLGVPGDVVGVVRFLLSPDSAFMTGQVLTVDGGISS